MSLFSRNTFEKIDNIIGSAVSVVSAPLNPLNWLKVAGYAVKAVEILSDNDEIVSAEMDLAADELAFSPRRIQLESFARYLPNAARGLLR